MSTDQELPPAETETTPKDSSSTVQNLNQYTTTNELETGSKPNPDSASSLPQVENGTTSKNPEEDDTGTSKQGTASHEIKPAENETSKDSDNTTQAAETSKQDPDPDDVGNLDKDASPPSAEDDKTSKFSSPPDNNPAQASSVDEQEAGGTKTSSQDSEPSVQEIPPPHDVSASKKDNVSQTSKITSLEKEEGTEASKRDSTPIENATISKESSSPPEDDDIDTHSMQTETRYQETDTDVIEDHPHQQDVTQSANEATPRHASSPNNVPTQSIATGTTEKVPNQETMTKDADSLPPVNEISPDESVDMIKHSSPLPTNFGNDVDSRQMKSSVWKKLSYFFFKRSKKSSGVSTTTKSENSITSPSGEKESSSKTSDDSTTTKSEKSITSPSEDKALPNLILADIESVHKETIELRNYNDRLIDLNEDARLEFHAEETNHKELRKSMIKLKLLIPSQTNVNSDVFKTLQSRLKARENIPKELLEVMPQLHKNKNFYSSPEIKDFEVLYERLESKLRLCLLCFSIFPGNETIRKRLMVRWWLAEGLSSEEEANNNFDKLREEGFIVPVNNNRSLNIGRYRMHPFYQSMLIKLAEKAKFFNFDDNGKPTQNYKNSFQACLVGDGLLSYKDLKDKTVSIDGLEKIHLMINVEESILDFKPQWFSKMRNVNMLYLGRWQASDAAHIEVEETNFLDGLKNMNSIKFLSLQGISNIIVLTESILALERLECLDLKACHNLEAIPPRIGSLTRLTHLDMSECYLLEHMPKSLSKLKNLKVFKGFVVSEKKYKDSCTLTDLKELKYLTKLCIYTNSKHFPNPRQVSCLEDIENLLKLSIAWGGEALKQETKVDTSNPSKVVGDGSKAETGGSTSHPSEAGGGDTLKVGTERDASKQGLNCFSFKGTPIWGKETSKAKIDEEGGGTSGDTIKDGIEKEPSKLLSKLEKLDLKCFPMKATPSWLKVSNSEHLKKLYIRGGRFSDLGQYQWINDQSQKKDVWKVKVLRLKYLSDLEMDWRQLHELFPDLVYLEQVSCPKLTLFDCGAGGVWINQTRLKVSAPN